MGLFVEQLKLKINTPAKHAEILHPQGIGKVTIARKTSNKRWIQNSYSVDHLPEIARMLDGEPDIFISQNRFYGRRLIANLTQLNALFADLDYYRIKDLHTHSPEQVYGMARELLDDSGIPLPNLAISTGRGVALIWLHDPVPRQALPRWIACQKRLYEILSPIGADRQALDAARVLRLIGTTNNTSNTSVRALNELTVPTWDFNTLADEVLPYTRATLHSLRIARGLKNRVSGNRPPKEFNAASLWEGRLAELQALRKHRHQQGRLPTGQRDAWLFLAGVAMSWLAPAIVMQRELYGLAREVAGWDDQESKSRMQAVIRRAHQAGQGGTVEWNGHKIDARYHFKDQTIIEWLDITEAEMEHLKFKHLSHEHLKRSRKRHKAKVYEEERRRKAGNQTRDDYEKQAQERRNRAAELRSQGLTWQQVATEMGISLEAAKSLGKRGNYKKGSSPLPCMVA